MSSDSSSVPENRANLVVIITEKYTPGRGYGYFFNVANNGLKNAENVILNVVFSGSLVDFLGDWIRSSASSMSLNIGTLDAGQTYFIDSNAVLLPSLFFVPTKSSAVIATITASDIDCSNIIITASHHS